MSNLDALLDTGFTAYNDGRFDQAEELAREVLTLSPSHGDALYLLGLIAFQAGALEPASELLYQGVKLYPHMENYALALASVLQKQGRLDEALSFYEKYKDNPQALSQIGLIYACKGQNEWAQNAFSDALNKDEKTIEAALGLAELLTRQGNTDEAETLLLNTLKNGPHLDVLYQLAVLLRKKGHFEQALSFIEQAKALHETPVILNEEGLIFEAMEQDKKALLSYIKSTQLSPYFADGYFNQGNIYQKQGKFQLAEDAYKRALVQDKKFLQAHHNLASLLYKQGRKAESLGYFQEAVILDSKYVPSIYNLAIVLEERLDFSEAAGLYFNALALGMKDKTIDFRIAACLAGLALQSENGKKQALMFAEGWIKNFPSSEVARHTWAALKGKKSEALEAYSKLFYDVFADSYEETMVKLECQVLDETIKLLKQKRYKKTLDLACGTGSFADKFKQNFKSILGVDLSDKMLDVARGKNLYTKLVCDTATHFLQISKQKFDLIVALELFCYLDEIETFFDAIPAHLYAGGLFAFSVEETPDGQDKLLSVTGRYLYSKSYVEKNLTRAGFSIQQLREINLRREGTGVARGFIVLATVA